MPSATAVAVVIETILFQTDAPDVVLARDIIGATYLCSLIALDRNGHHFLAVQISSDRLASLRNGRVDLREALTTPELPVHYQGRLLPGDEKLIHLETVDEVPEAWLPDEGFLLSNFVDEVSDEDVVKEALSKNAAVIVCGVNPPEARGIVPKVNADRLAEWIKGFQTLVRHATKNALSKMPSVRKAQFGDDAFVLQVFRFSPGSFNVHFESKQRADLIGASIVGTAMQQIDDLMELAGKPVGEALEGFKRNRGHVLAAYQTLMKFVADEEAPIAYRWSEPAMVSARGGRVTPDEARAMVAILDKEETLRVEQVAFHGRFTSVNTDNQPLSWSARDENLKRRHGYVHETALEVLDGTTIKTQPYLFRCEERLVKPASGRETIKLFLRSVDRE